MMSNEKMEGIYPFPPLLISIGNLVLRRVINNQGLQEEVIKNFPATTLP
jgi:hypothetical protein